MTARFLQLPAHPRSGCAGVVFLLLLAQTACREAPATRQPVVLHLDGDTVQLAPGVKLVDIEVRVAESEFDPANPQARVGDVIRFTARDGGSHAIAFDGSRLAATAASFLENTGQMRGPPLLHDGASWIVSLADAPAGEYAFRCLTHSATGRLTVTAAS